MLPQEAKLRNFTYASTMTIDLDIQYIIKNTEKMDNPKIIKKKIQKINIGKMPIMIKSGVCTLTQNRHISHLYTRECPMDSGGYFIIKGSEKTVLGQERAAENRIYCFDGKNTTKWLCYAEIKSIPDNKCISPKQFEISMFHVSGQTPGSRGMIKVREAIIFHLAHLCHQYYQILFLFSFI